MYDYLKLQPNNPIVMEEKLADEKSKEEHMADYLESMKALEEAMEPYKEQKRELFRVIGWSGSSLIGGLGGARQLEGNLDDVILGWVIGVIIVNTMHDAK